MKRITTIALAIALTLSIAGIAAAQPGPQRMDRREARQELRIRHGMRNGQLTRGEVYRLRMGQRHFRRMELRARRDGCFGMRERIRMHRALDRQSARIWRLRHNGRCI